MAKPKLSEADKRLKRLIETLSGYLGQCAKVSGSVKLPPMETSLADGVDRAVGGGTIEVVLEIELATAKSEESPTA